MDAEIKDLIEENCSITIQELRIRIKQFKNYESPRPSDYKSDKQQQAEFKKKSKTSITRIS